jgi:hypothetical protein
MQDRTFDMQGSADHAHLISFPAHAFQALSGVAPESGAPPAPVMTFTSSTDNGHYHSVTVSCANLIDAGG